MARMNEALGEVAVVGEKDESFTLGIEPAHVKQPRKFRRKQIEDRVTRMRIAAESRRTRLACLTRDKPDAPMA